MRGGSPRSAGISASFALDSLTCTLAAHLVLWSPDRRLSRYPSLPAKTLLAGRWIVQPARLGFEEPVHFRIGEDRVASKQKPFHPSG